MITKMCIFQKVLMDHEDFVSGKLFVSFYHDIEHCNEMPRTQELLILRENIFFLFCTENTYSKCF